MAGDRNGLFQKLQKLFRSGPIVKSRITRAAGSYVEIAASSYLAHTRTSNSMYANSVSCVAGDTLIATTKGYIRIDELATLPRNEKFEVISYDIENKKLAIDIAYDARKTKTNKTLKITFDNSAELVCTYDHLVLCKDGEYRHAKDLRVNDSVMPLYDADWFGYQSIAAPGSKFITTHKLVAETFYRKVEKDEVVHHKDFNKRNNTQTNLEIMTRAAHTSLHALLAAMQENPGKRFTDWYDNHPDKDIRSKQVKKAWADNHDEMYEKIFTPETCKKFSDIQIESWATNKERKDILIERIKSLE